MSTETIDQWAGVTIELFPREWLPTFEEVINSNNVRVVIYETHEVDEQYVRLIMGVQSPLDLVMAGYYWGHHEVEKAITDTIPKVMSNVENLINKFTIPSKS